MHVIGSRACQRVQDLLRHEQPAAVGVQSQATDIVGGEFANMVDFAANRVDDCQLAAECVGYDQPFVR